MTAAQRAKQVLTDLNQSAIDGVYCVNLPPQVQDETEQTVVLITEVNDLPTTYGSNRTNGMEETVAVNLFYAENSTVNFDHVELAIVDAFEEHGWYCTYSPGHSLDPDTLQVTKVFQFKHLIRKDDI